MKLSVFSRLRSLINRSSGCCGTTSRRCLASPRRSQEASIALMLRRLRYRTSALIRFGPGLCLGMVDTTGISLRPEESGWKGPALRGGSVRLSALCALWVEVCALSALCALWVEVCALSALCALWAGFAGGRVGAGVLWPGPEGEGRPRRVEIPRWIRPSLRS